MAKTPKKVKEPVRLREKQLSDGSKSLYLEYYKGYSIGENGEIKTQKEYEFLKLYLIPETNPLQKQINANTMKAANAIKAQRIIELANGKAGIKDSQQGKMLFVDWIDYYKTLKADKSKGLLYQIDECKRIVIGYSGEKTRLRDVDVEYCRGFINYLTNVHTTSTGKHYEKVSAQNIYRIFSRALNAAVKRDLIPINPCSKLGDEDKIDVPPSKRTYLTIDEVKTLIDTPCRSEEIKRAYLFSAFCGLRISDVCRLRWADIVVENGKTKVELVQKKTGNPLYLPLSQQALCWLPERGKKANSEAIFTLPTECPINDTLREWATAAGINKNVTFHTSRHTFATMMLTLGADLYTTSKLLGHSDVKTTQIYAKIVDKKKEEAVSLVDNVF